LFVAAVLEHYFQDGVGLGGNGDNLGQFAKNISFPKHQDAFEVLQRKIPSQLINFWGNINFDSII
jgi:hypothetical protein